MRCPRCGAAARPDAPWCTLCFAPLAPDPEPPAPDPEPPAAELAPAEEQPSTPQPGWPCPGCGAVVALAEDRCPACDTAFLGPLREQESPLVAVPGVGDLSRLSRGQRFALALAVALVVVALTAVAGVVLH